MHRLQAVRGRFLGVVARKREAVDVEIPAGYRRWAVGDRARANFAARFHAQPQLKRTAERAIGIAARGVELATT